MPHSVTTNPLYRRTFGEYNFEVAFTGPGLLRTLRPVGGRLYDFRPEGSCLIITEVDTATGAEVELLDVEGDGGGVPEREGEGVPEGEGGEEALTPPAGLRLSRGVALAQPPLTLAERDGEAVADSLRTDGEGVSEAPGEAVSATLGEARLEDEARAVT